MLRHIFDVLRHQSLGVVALFIALGGTSYAVADIGNRAVKSRHIAPNAVTASKIAPNAVNSDDVQDGSLLTSDFRPGQIPKGEPGERGPEGPRGASGSPDTARQVLDKLTTVDGAGSGLDADAFGGLAPDAFQRRITGTCGAGRFVQTVDADGDVSCSTGLEVPLRLNQSDTNSTSEVATLTQAGDGVALNVNTTSPFNAARGINVSHAGDGNAIFATSSEGTAIQSAASTLFSAAYIGDSPIGEVIVGRQSGSGCDPRPSGCTGIGAVVGRHDGRGGYGVRGFATDPLGGIGVLGQSGVSGGTGTGVRGENINASNTGYGVEGSTVGGGAGIHGIESSTDPAALAGLFDGNVRINGDLTVTGTKTGFRIDDPRDPAHRTLSHTPVETDALTVVYTGNVRTGRDGRATVRLPAYATTLAADWRYQLTPIGRFGQAIVASEVRNGRFVIRTEHGGTKVSWSVTGLRRDPFARDQRFRAEQDKLGSERGRYLHPELYGRPSAASVIRPTKTATRRPRLASERRR